jgi:hypothetical protein
MLLFLHSLRNAAIVLVSIPTSIVSTFVMMKVVRVLAQPDVAAGPVAGHRYPGGRRHRGDRKHLPAPGNGQKRVYRPPTTAARKSALPPSASRWWTWWCFCPSFLPSGMVPNLLAAVLHDGADLHADVAARILHPGALAHLAFCQTPFQREKTWPGGWCCVLKYFWTGCPTVS